MTLSEERFALPIAWDGHPIVWGDWESVSDLTWCGGVTAHGWRGCRHCHARALPRSILGHVDVGIGPGINLSLFRCMTCGYSTVLEMSEFTDGREWVLDSSDYGLEGSWNVELEQGELVL
ncbi:hypothetical protein BPY_23000 [Bifidobacterium psychraerophilum]|uniref:hypothetical protein n=1 Tax=Bifidobacterium psychraerophilum TaxID=218140 RepID=UPI0031154157